MKEKNVSVLLVSISLLVLASCRRGGRPMLRVVYTGFFLS